MSKLPKSYIVNKKRKCCRTCYFIHILCQQDEHDEFFCTFGQPPRPRDGSYHDENEKFISPKNDEEWERLGDQIELWSEWSQGLSVDGVFGLCKHYKRKNKEITMFKRIIYTIGQIIRKIIGKDNTIYQSEW